MVNAHDALLRGHGLQSLGQAAELVIRSAAILARAPAGATGDRGERPSTPGSRPSFLRLSADSRLAQAARDAVQSHDPAACVTATASLPQVRDAHHNAVRP